MYVAEQGTQHGNFKPMNCQSFVREEDIKVGRRLKIAQLHTWHIQKEGTRMHNPVYPISATSCQGNKIWHYDNWEHLRIQRDKKRAAGTQRSKSQSGNWRNLSLLQRFGLQQYRELFSPDPNQPTYYDLIQRLHAQLLDPSRHPTFSSMSH